MLEIIGQVSEHLLGLVVTITNVIPPSIRSPRIRSCLETSHTFNHPEHILDEHATVMPGRRGNKKSRNGCIACKRRHIKVMHMASVSSQK